MKKMIAIVMCCVVLSGCSGERNQEIVSEIVPETIEKEEIETTKGIFGVQYEKEPLRMVNIDGELYFDSGLLSDAQEHTGVMERGLSKTAKIGEVPKEEGTANFDCEGCRKMTKITCDILVDGEWRIFKKFENLAGETQNLTGFPYCFYIKGRLNNAVIDSELVVLTGDSEVTFSDVFEPMLSSQYLPDAPQKAISIDFVQSGDPWGITCLPRQLTNHSMTFQIEQFGGNYDGRLQTGEWYQIYQMKEDEWVAVKPELLDYAFYEISYLISKNDITEFEIDWEWLYGELAPGYYRLDKEIMDFRETGDYSKEIYSVYFTIE